MADQSSPHHHQKPPDRQWTTLAPTIVLTAIATLVVALRLLTRHRIVHALGSDDAIIALSLLLSWAVCGLTVAEVQAGIGAYVWTSELDLTPRNARLVLGWNCAYMVLVNVTKASVLVQYLRIFVGQTMRALTFLLLGALVPALLWGVLGGVLLCRPVAKLWLPGVEGHCMSLRTYWLSTASVNIVLDFSTVLLPVPAISRLRLPTRQKVGLVLVFLLGFFVCGVSLSRLALVHIATIHEDWTDASVDAFTWSTVEANTGIICASILALKPLFVKMFPRLMSEPGRARHSNTLPTIRDDSHSTGKEGDKETETRDSSVTCPSRRCLTPKRKSGKAGPQYTFH